MFLRNVGSLSTDYKALYPRRKCSSRFWLSRILNIRKYVNCRYTNIRIMTLMLWQ
jgi:hypothetical protein